LKNKVISIVLFLSAIIMLVSCRPQKAEWKGTIEEENGVTIVKNPKEPMYGEEVFSLEEELSIGEAEGKKEYMFSDIRDIKVFNKNGEYLRTIGGKGQGPGELNYPTYISITHQNELMVNAGNRSLSFFTLDGKHIKSLSTAKIFTGRADINSKGNIIIHSYKRVPPNTIYELKMYDSTLNFILTYGSCSIPSGTIRESYPFRPFFWWQIANNDNIVYGYPKTYEIQILNSEGKVIKRILREYDPVEVTQEEKEEYMKDYEKGHKFHFPQYYSAYRWFILDDEGRIYVRTFEKIEDGNGYYNDIFDSKGRYLVKIALRFTPRVLKKNKLYMIEEDEEGYQVVKRYKVKWNF
jgi:hypothetical protein